MSGQGETIYRCPSCDGVLLITSVPTGVVRAVLCKRCNKRHTVFLGGQRKREDLGQHTPSATPSVPVPRLAPSTPPRAIAPPIETRTIRGARRG
jgi:hypothetical protein